MRLITITNNYQTRSAARIMSAAASRLFAMGVDGHIFDEASRECLDFDRMNHLTCGVDFDGITGIIFDRLMLARVSPFRFASSADVIRLMDACMAVRVDEGEGYTYWCEAVRKFAENRPDGRFFIANDHQDPSNHDIILSGRYTVVDK